MHRFLTVMIETGGNVRAACRSIRISRTAAYAWRREDEDFRKAWDLAMDLSTQALEDEAITRATTGRNRPVFYQGRVVGSIRERSDLLLMFMLKARRPDKYRDRFDLVPPGASTPVTTGPLIDQVADSVRAANAILATPITIEPAPLGPPQEPAAAEPAEPAEPPPLDPPDND